MRIKMEACSYNTNQRENSSKPKRAKNFSEYERSLLLTLVKKRQSVIECKRTDVASVKEKEAVWKIIADEFNQKCDTFRDFGTLRMKSKNMKKACKRKFSEEKRCMINTGGGPSEVSKISTEDWALKDMLGSQIDGRISNFDSDQQEVVVFEEAGQWEVMEEAVVEVPVAAPEECEVTTLSQILISGPSSDDQSSEKQKNYEESPKGQLTQDEQPPRMIKLSQPRSTPLRVKKQRTRGLDDTVAGQKITDLSLQKLQLLELQKKVSSFKISFFKNTFHHHC